MESSADGDAVIAKLEDGDDLVRSIGALATKHRIANGMVMWGIGMLRDFEIGYFNGKEYERTTYAEPMELLALHGSYAVKADPRLHVHVAAAGRDHHVVGGHLFRATVAVLNEICMRRLRAAKLTRVLNPRSGLKELVVGAPDGEALRRRPRGR
jgi:predicted DNA-binding protein with PD1-like motif